MINVINMVTVGCRARGGIEAMTEALLDVPPAPARQVRRGGPAFEHLWAVLAAGHGTTIG